MFRPDMSTAAAHRNVAEDPGSAGGANASVRDGGGAVRRARTGGPRENRTIPPFPGLRSEAGLRAARPPRAGYEHHPPTASLVALQEWEGYVTEISEEGFTARLIDLTADSPYEEEEASIPLAEISEDDAESMRLGSVFRWAIGYERSPSGTKRRVSQIVFRNLPAVTPSDRREGEKWARAVLRSFDT